MITRTLKGHTFAVQLRAVERAGQLANGAPAYTAHATIYRDGADLGSAHWDPEGFTLGSPLLLQDIDDSEDVYLELAVAIHEHLAALPVETPQARPAVDGDGLARRIIEMLRDAAKDNEHIPVEFGEKSPGRHQCIGHLAAWREALYRAELLEREERATRTQSVTFAPGLRGDGLRRMAARARDTADLSLREERRAWYALSDELDAAAERDEAGNAPEAP